MNDVSAHSDREVSYWKAWFHFWILSFPNGSFTKDYENPSFYYSVKKEKVRRWVHALGITFICVILLQLIFYRNEANAQAQYGGPNCANYGTCYGSSGSSGSGSSGSGSSQPGHAYNPNNIGSHGSGAPDRCTQEYLDAVGDSSDPRVIAQANAAMIQCEMNRPPGGYWPNTACEWISIVGFGGGLGAAALAAPSLAGSSLGGAAAGAAYTNYIYECDGR